MREIYIAKKVKGFIFYGVQKLLLALTLLATVDTALLLLLAGEDDTFELLFEPLDGLVLLDVVGVTDGGAGALALGDAFTAAAEDDVEVHTVDTSGGVVLIPRSMCSLIPKPKEPVLEKLLVRSS